MLYHNGLAFENMSFLHKCQSLIKQKGQCISIFFVCIACVVMGAITRIVYCLKYPVPVRDAYEYAGNVADWSETGILHSSRRIPPLFLFLVKECSRYTDYDIMKTGVVLNVLLGLVLVFLSIIIADKLSGSWLVCLIVGAIAATHPTMVEYSCQMLRENSFLVFLFLEFILLMEYAKTQKIHLILICAFCGMCSIFCRLEGVEIIIPAIAAIIFFNIQKKHSKKCIQDLACYVCMAIFSFFILNQIMGISNQYMIEAFTILLEQ